ncbi:MAG TPA: ABC transporter substrate-binding protein [Candidatus Binatia bacterium]|nr:ABC transporter substrate-binding protein [Candidatus Binatia bacterium]
MAPNVSMNRRGLLFSVVTIAGLFAAITLGGCGDKVPDQSSPRTKVVIGYSKLRISLPVFVAKERGLFAKHGIEAELRAYDDAQLMITSLVQGNIQVGGYTALPISFKAMTGDKRKQLYYLTAMVEDKEHRISYLLRRKSQDASKPSVRGIGDLGGKRIGILPTIAYRAWIAEILRANGVTVDAKLIENVPPDRQASMLRDGAVEALFTNDPAATAAIRANIAELISEEVDCPKYFGSPFLFGSFNVEKSWADANKDVVKAIAAVLDEAIAIIDKEGVGANVAMESFISADYKADVRRYPAAKYITTSALTVEAVQAVADKYREMGILSERVDVASLVGLPK